MKGETTEFGKRKRNGGSGSLHSTHFRMMIVLLFAAIMLLETTEAGTNVVRRGFKSSLLSTARGFGKRASLFDRGIIPTTAIGFGKRSPLDNLPRVQKARNGLNPQDISSLQASHVGSPYELDTDSLMHHLNVEASKNPHMIPLLLEVIRSGARPEDEDTDIHVAGYDDSQPMLSNRW